MSTLLLIALLKVNRFLTIHSKRPIKYDFSLRLQNTLLGSIIILSLNSFLASCGFLNILINSYYYNKMLINFFLNYLLQIKSMV